MVLKRKRSDSELLPVFNSPARSDSSVESFDVPISPSLAFPRAFATPAHLSSRTMKRFRDNRPSEDEIHQRTLKMLYSAQHHNETLVHDSSPSPAPAPTARSTQKSLHSFWNIKSAAPTPSRTSSPPVDQMMMDSVSCEDCGVGLGPSDDATDGVIAVVGAAGKAVSLYIKLKSLYDELSNAPDTLLGKVEELQFLDEYFHEAETQVSAGPTLDVLLRDVMVQRAIGRARAAMGDLHTMIDNLSARINSSNRYKRKLGAARVVFQKGNMEAMDRKLDRALGLFNLAQQLYCAKVATLCASASLRFLRDKALTPFVRDEDDWSLLQLSVEIGAANITRWLLDFGLYAGSFAECQIVLNSDKPLSPLFYIIFNHYWSRPPA
ncbi:hypothetical protein Cob_v012838 [Colletotrichum orbiculare MAFF 240422]|uniref:Uncharacterized protein n=1 Tax=Colletotrichum orbiculare (strain 104-T / ATCC 96160 / CBS 514.97 / LARS 414 / MAFF 240422) TaxID=1213857 RepID=A0A484F8V7_COLOR|nr:hypothetical protein Cob_v012838 [Colletotrichum orbiculare MAFF 240422]